MVVVACITAVSIFSGLFQGLSNPVPSLLFMWWAMFFCVPAEPAYFSPMRSFLSCHRFNKGHSAYHHCLFDSLKLWVPWRFFQSAAQIPWRIFSSHRSFFLLQSSLGVLDEQGGGKKQGLLTYFSHTTTMECPCYAT